MPALPVAYLRGIAERIILHAEERDGDLGRVFVLGAGVGDSRKLSARDARAAQLALTTTIERRLVDLVAMKLDDARKFAERLVEIDADGTVRVCGSELVGAEDPHAAADRARSMRERLVAALEAALDEAPVTSRRTAGRR